MNDFPEKEIETTENLFNEEAAKEEVAEFDESSTIFSAPTEHKETAKKEKNKLWPKIIAAVLAVGILVGGTVAVIKLIPEKEDETESTPVVNTIEVLKKNSDKFKTLTLTNENGSFKFYLVESTEEVNESDTSSETPETIFTWYLDGYSKDVVDTTKIAEIVESLESINALREITTKTAADCGFDKPTYKAEVVEKDGKTFTFLVGDRSPDNTGNYIKLADSDKIYLTEKAFESFNFGLLDLASSDSIGGVPTTFAMKDYIDENSVLVTFDSITISGTKYPESIVIVPNSDKQLSEYAAFLTTEPTKRIAGNVDSVFTFFKEGVSSSGAYALDATEATKKALGFDKSEVIVKIKIGDYTREIFFKLQEDGNYAVWHEGANFIKKITPDSLSFLDYKVTDYYSSWVCLHSLSALKEFTIKTASDTYTFGIKYTDSDEVDDKFEITYEGEKYSTTDFQNLYQECIAIACTSFETEKITTKPDLTFIFNYAAEETGAVEVAFYKVSETKYQYSVDGEPMGKVNATAISKALKAVQKAVK